MIRLPHFDIEQPATLVEAAELLRKHGEDALVYAGGTELLLAMKLAGMRCSRLIDIKRIPDTTGIASEGRGLRIGATTTHRQLARSEVVAKVLPALSETAARIANPRVRAAGTIGGNLCFAEPHSDIATLLVSLDAECVMSDGRQVRRLPVVRFLLGAFETALMPSELLVSVAVPVVPQAWTFYEKFQFRERPALGVAGSFVVSEREGSGSRPEIGHAAVVVGCAGPVPFRSRPTDEILMGPLPDVARRVPRAAELLAEGAGIIDDDDGSREYKQHLIGVILARKLAELARQHGAGASR